MAELDLTTIFNDCVDRINQGQTIDECLRRYPQYSATLRPMLEAGTLVQRMRVDPAEILVAQARVRRRFDDALRAPPKRTKLIRQVAYAVAAIFIIGFVAVGSLTAAAQNSLPGDPLYGLKTFSEGLQRTLFDDDALETSFDQRRIQEIQQLLALGRAETVSFAGVVTSKNESSWTIASLPITVTTDVPNVAAVRIGDEVDVTAHTSVQHTLIASSIHVTQPANIPIPTPPANTQVPPTATPTNTLTATPTASETPMILTSNTPQPTTTTVPSPLPSFTSTVVTTIESVPQIVVVTPTICTATRPDGWVNYRIQSGDTLSALAAGQSISLTELMAVNCISDASRIVIGETVFLPRTPLVAAPTATNSSTNENAGSSNVGTDNSGSSESGDDHGGGSNSGHGGGGSDDGSGHN